MQGSRKRAAAKSPHNQEKHNLQQTNYIKNTEYKRTQEKGGKRRKNQWDKQKINSKMVDLN